MSLALILAACWGLLANVLAMIPSRDNHWRRAYFLMATGAPILAFVIYQNGLLIGLLVLLAGMSMLRWPVIYATRWIKRRFAASTI